MPIVPAARAAARPVPRSLTPAATALLLLALASPALADTLRGEARVSRVTLFPDGAQVTRAVTLEAAPGPHRLVIPGLPQGTDPAALRLSASGARIGAVSLQTDRALPPDLAEPAPVTAARTALQAAEQALRRHDMAVQGVRARADAARETIAFLRDLAKSDGAATGDLAALATSVEARILAARQTILAAEAEAEDMAPAREPLVRAVERARAALEAVDPPEGETAALVVDLEATGPGPAVIEATTLDDRAGWEPVYDARLDPASGALSLDRGVLVRQQTGEDWQGVALTLSTARPAEQAAPSDLEPQIVSLGEDVVMERQVGGAMADMAAAPMAPAPAPEARVAAQSRMQGLTLVFDYPRPADIRSGADGLRLALDSVALKPEVRAEAVPLYDTRATLVAEAVNGTDLLLPGTVSLYSGEALVGTAGMDLTAPGDRLVLGFGPIDGLTVERRTRDREAGDRGLIARQQTEAETVEIEVKNLTARDWPLRVIDRVPVSESEDLRVAWTAEPKPTTTDPEGRRGILWWDAPLAKGETRTITLTTDLRWPEGKVLMR